jgi:hypothetical protein
MAISVARSGRFAKDFCAGAVVELFYSSAQLAQSEFA